MVGRVGAAAGSCAEGVTMDGERIFREHYATDIVRGQIIGGDYLRCKLMYQGREQRSFSADNDADAKARAGAVLAEIKAECGQAYPLIYRDPGAWELRIYG